MRIQVKPIGYRFRVTNDTEVFDIVSITEVSMTKSSDIIRKFFENFKIINVDKRVKPEDFAIGMRSAMKGGVKNAGEKNAVRSVAKRNDRALISGESKWMRSSIRPTDKSEKVEKKSVKPMERIAEKSEKNAMMRSKPVVSADKSEKNAMMRSKPVVRSADKSEKNILKSEGQLVGKKRETVKEIWRKLGKFVNDEFTLQEYISLLRNAGYKYTKSSWEAVPSQQITRLIELGEIEKIGVKRPFKFRKIKVSTNVRSEKMRELLKI